MTRRGERLQPPYEAEPTDRFGCNSDFQRHFLKAGFKDLWRHEVDTCGMLDKLAADFNSKVHDFIRETAVIKQLTDDPREAIELTRNAFRSAQKQLCSLRNQTQSRQP